MGTKLYRLLLLCFVLSSCQGQKPGQVASVDVKTFSEKLKTTENPQLLDVRTPEEFSPDHIEKARNIDWNGPDFVAQAQKLDKSRPVFVYCKVGGRSSQAAHKLAELGFAQIYNLDGGIMKWRATYGEAQKNGKIIGICPQEFDEMVRAGQKTIVNFYAKWCEPCKKMEPYLLKMQTELKDAKLVRLDADQNKTILETLKFDGLPVILVYENGKETWRHVGYLSEEELRKHL